MRGNFGCGTPNHRFMHLGELTADADLLAGRKLSEGRKCLLDTVR